MPRNKGSENENDEDEEGKEIQETRQGAGKRRWSIVHASRGSFSRISKTCMYDKEAPLYTGRFNLRILHSTPHSFIGKLGSSRLAAVVDARPAKGTRYMQERGNREREKPVLMS